MRYSRPLARGRGLKHNALAEYITGGTSPPRTGAWIETEDAGLRIAKSPGRPLARGRGLKRNEPRFVAMDRRRPLARGRGLKPIVGADMMCPLPRRPLARGRGLKQFQAEQAEMDERVAPSHGGVD